MTVESASYISQLDTTLPTAADLISEGDDHLRLTKTVLKTQFPNFGATAITASAAEVNYLVGVTSAVQTQLNARALKAGDTYTGAHNFTGASSVTGPTPTAGDNSNKFATTAFATNLAFATALPAQAGNSGKFITTDGSTASWSSTLNGGLNFSGTGLRLTGDFSNATPSNRLSFSSSTTNDNTTIQAIPNGTAQISGFAAFNASAIENSASWQALATASDVRFVSGIIGTATYLPMTFYTGGSERLRIDTGGNVLVTGAGGLGYGTGSGGTVTQGSASGKGTTVTINKSSGQITMDSGNLAAGASIGFVVNNSLVAATDLIHVTGFNGVVDPGNYRIEPLWVGSQSFAIRVTNISAVNRGEGLVINFSVYRGTTS